MAAFIMSADDKAVDVGLLLLELLTVVGCVSSFFSVEDAAVLPVPTTFFFLLRLMAAAIMSEAEDDEDLLALLEGAVVVLVPSA